MTQSARGPSSLCLGNGIRGLLALYDAVGKHFNSCLLPNCRPIAAGRSPFRDWSHYEPSARGSHQLELVGRETCLKHGPSPTFSLHWRLGNRRRDTNPGMVGSGERPGGRVPRLSSSALCTSVYSSAPLPALPQARTDRLVERAHGLVRNRRDPSAWPCRAKTPGMSRW